MHSSRAGTNISEGMIKLKYKSCNCAKKIGERISKSTNNSSKLYFHCDQRKSKYYSFWLPNNEEFNIYDEATSQQRKN